MDTQISTLKRYALSSLITFLTTFIITLSAQLSAGNIDLANVGTSTIVAVAVVAGRAAVKAVVEKLAGMMGDKTA